MICALLSTGPAVAYEIARTANEEQHELHWDRAVIPFSLVIHGQEGPDPTELDDALIASFRSWGEVTTASLQLVRDDSPVAAASEPDGRNVLYWTEENWRHDALVIALTSINYYPDTGLIADADIDFNGQEFVWTTSIDTPRVDVQSIATHEIGHVFGLDHSEDQDAVMWWEYLIYPNGMGETRQRTLHEDDILGISYLYPCEERKVVVGDDLVSSTGGESCDEPFFVYPDFGPDSGPWDASCSAGRGAGRGGVLGIGLLAILFAMRRRPPSTRLPLLALGLLLVGVASQPASHASVSKLTGLEALAASASSAVLGRVTGVEPVLAASGHVHSLVTLEVEEWIGGDGPATLVLERPSGEMADFGTYVPGDPRFELDQDVLLFLAERWDGSQGIVGMDRGFFAVEWVDGVRAVRPPRANGTRERPPLLLEDALESTRSSFH